MQSKQTKTQGAKVPFLNKETMNDNWYYSQMTTEELTKVVNDNSHLEGYRKRCNEELTKRKQL